MLSEENLKLLSTKLQTSFANVAREYVQNLFLSYFYSAEGSGNILFKGGTALRLLYRSSRFSEDLDFSCASIKPAAIEDLIQGVLLKLEAEGIAVDIKESTMTTGGFLAILNLVMGGEEIGIKLEISGRKKKLKGELIMVDNPYFNAYSVMALAKDELAAEKVEALLSRKKPRDFFDLYFMLRANLLPRKAVLKEILPIVQQTKVNFKEELGAFLPRSLQPIIKNFKKTLEQEIRRHL